MISESSRERVSGVNSKIAPFPVVRVMLVMVVEEMEKAPLPREKRGCVLATPFFDEMRMLDNANAPVSAMVKREVKESEEVST